MDFAVWNTLHDGAIEAIDGTVPGDVKVRVGIEYICAKLPTSIDYVMVHLTACTRFTFEPFEGHAVQDLAAIAAGDFEVLSAKSTGDVVSVYCTDGVLKLSYKSVKTYTGEGLEISQTDLESAAKRYWTEWSANADRAGG